MIFAPKNVNSELCNNKLFKTRFIISFLFREGGDVDDTSKRLNIRKDFKVTNFMILPTIQFRL